MNKRDFLLSRSSGREIYAVQEGSRSIEESADGGSYQQDLHCMGVSILDIFSK
jgi:hypothetical protein